ncbi:putative heavy metal-associated domain, HMA, heavy metal-associated domain superfamily [Helianthus annuus]|nr:heavy metal-associated isoprenylated plant protein 45 isoform X2 [Helianthus annuus]KAJ0438797.1 putative heavy metal-associated domain, HMA, heavy metal-associated domain superfamily [Helianthus annuus]
MIVNMDCHGCERKIRRALQNLDGVENIEIDMNMQKVTVTGWVDQEKVLKKIRRTGKKAELWPFPNNPEMVGYTQEYADMYSSHSDPSTYFHERSSHRSLPATTMNLGMMMVIAVWKCLTRRPLLVKGLAMRLVMKM